MSMSFAGAWQQMTGRRAARPRWVFEVDRSQAPVRVAWRWQRLDDGHVASTSAGSFASFASCARDAEAHGFMHSHAYSLREQARPPSGWARPEAPGEPKLIPQ